VNYQRRRGGTHPLIDEVRDLVKIERTAGEHQQADCDTDQPVGTGMHRLAEREALLAHIERKSVERVGYGVTVREQAHVFGATADEECRGNDTEQQCDEGKGQPAVTPVTGD
jgi:hypothetical protein